MHFISRRLFGSRGRLKLTVGCRKSLIDIEIADDNISVVVNISRLTVTVEANAEVFFIYAIFIIEPIKACSGNIICRYRASESPYAVDQHEKLI